MKETPEQYRSEITIKTRSFTSFIYSAELAFDTFSDFDVAWLPTKKRYKREY